MILEIRDDGENETSGPMGHRVRGPACPHCRESIDSVCSSDLFGKGAHNGQIYFCPNCRVILGIR